MFHDSADMVADQTTVFGPSTGGRTEPEPADLERFRRAVIELGLIPGAEFERFVAGALGGVPGLAKALVMAGKLTPYQAGALAQGKARGLVIGNYFILDKLGQGGMGLVFKARHRRLGRVVALKILPPSLARNQDLLSRFRREVDVAAKLSHPNVVSVLDADEDRGVQFMTMEYIKGNDLDRLVRDGGVMPVDLALDCAIQGARGIQAAHAQGIVHRDIKPGNLILDDSGVVRVLDLGLARLVEAANPFGETAPKPLTQSGTYMGTVDFMAPEQGVDSRTVDHRADIYSLGCTLCYLLTGRPPFDGRNVLARLMQHQQQPPASLRAARPDVPKSIDKVYQTLMAKKPDDRPASMTEVVNLLEACRALSGGEEESRSSLQSFAASAILKRAAPKGAVVDSSVFKRDEPAPVRSGPGPNLEDVLFEGQKPNAVEPAVVEPRSPHRKPAAARPVRPRAKSGASALVFGAVVLLAAGGVGYALFVRKAADKSVDQGPTAVSTPGETSATVDDVAPTTSFAPAPVTEFDAFQVGSVWENRAKKLNLEVLERGLGAFKARLTTGSSQREVTGSIQGGKFGWRAVDVRVIRGSRGDDNHGTIQGNSLELTWNGRTPGSTTLSRDPSKGEAPRSVGSGTTLEAATCYTTAYESEVWTGLSVTADGRRAFIGGRVQFPFLLNVETGHVINPKTPFQWEGASILDTAITPDGRRGVLGTYRVGKQNQNAAKAKFEDRGFLVFFDLTTGAHLFPRQQPHAGDVSAVAITPDGLRALSGSSTGELTLWDLGSGQVIRQLGPQIGGVASHALSFFPGGRKAASGGKDQLVHVWNLDTGGEVGAWPGHQKGITGLAVSADGRRIVTGSGDGSVILRDAESGTLLHRFAMPDGDFGARVAFDQEWNIIAAGNGQGGTPAKPGRLIVWSSRTYDVIRQDELPFTRHLAVAALPGGRVMTADAHGVRLWTPRSPGSHPSPPQADGDTKPVDLIRSADASVFKSGNWRIESGELFSPPGNARFQFSRPPPSDYRLELDVERTGKDSEYAVGVGIVVDGRQTEITVDRKNSEGTKFTGLSGYHGLAIWSSLNRHQGGLLIPHRTSHLEVTVHRGAIAMTCDGATVMDWNGDPRLLIPSVGWNVRDPDKIFLATSSEVKFHKVTMTPLPGGSR